MSYIHFIKESTTASIPSHLQPTQSRGGNDHEQSLQMNWSLHVGNFSNRAEQSKCSRTRKIISYYLLITTMKLTLHLCHPVFSLSSLQQKKSVWCLPSTRVLLLHFIPSLSWISSLHLLQYFLHCVFLYFFVTVSFVCLFVNYGESV